MKIDQTDTAQPETSLHHALSRSPGLWPRPMLDAVVEMLQTGRFYYSDTIGSEVDGYIKTILNIDLQGAEDRPDGEYRHPFTTTDRQRTDELRPLLQSYLEDR